MPPLREGSTGFWPGRRGNDQCGVHGACSQSSMFVWHGGRGSTQGGRSQGGIVVSHSGRVGAMVGAAVLHGGLSVGVQMLHDLAQLVFM